MVLIRHLCPSTMPSTWAFLPVRSIGPEACSLNCSPLASVTVVPPADGRFLSAVIQPASSALEMNWPVGSGGAPATGSVNSTPPGMPSSEIVSVWTRPVVLICSSAEPCRKTPYCSRKAKLVWNAATPQNSRSSSASPFSSTNGAAPEARLPSLMTLIVPEALIESRKRVEPSASVRLPISIETLPRISMIGSSKTSASRSSMPPERSMKKTRSGVAGLSVSIVLKLSLLPVPSSPLRVAPATLVERDLHEPCDERGRTGRSARCARRPAASRSGR